MYQKGRLYSGSTSVSHTEGPGFDSLPLHDSFFSHHQLWLFLPKIKAKDPHAPIMLFYSFYFQTEVETEELLISVKVMKFRLIVLHLLVTTVEYYLVFKDLTLLASWTSTTASRVAPIAKGATQRRPLSLICCRKI
jgi:hypothetical protein